MNTWLSGGRAWNSAFGSARSSGRPPRAVSISTASGASAESGIPAFPSKNGLYHRTEKRLARYKPEDYLSYACVRNAPDVFFDTAHPVIIDQSQTPMDRGADLVVHGSIGKVLTAVNERL